MDKPQGFKLGNLFSFDRMITTEIIQVAYVIALIIVILTALGSISPMIHTMGMLGLLGSLGLIIVGILGVRIFFEGLIVIFRVYEVLLDIKELLKRQGSS